jgi:hypothetical protein
MTSSPSLAILVLALGLVLSSACAGGSGSDSFDLVLRTTGDPADAQVTYRLPGGQENSETVSLPWEMPVTVSGDWSVRLSVTNPGLEGEVTCSLGGLRLPVGATGEASATCSASGNASEVSTSARGEAFVRVDGEPAALASLRAPAGRPALRAFAATGDIAWSAAGNALLRTDIVSGDQVRSELATGVNGIATDGAGALYAASNSSPTDKPEDLVRVKPDGTEEPFFSVIALGSQVAATTEVVWVTTDEPDLLLAIDAVTGQQLADFAGEFEILAAFDDVALVWAGESTLQTVDTGGRVVAEREQPSRLAAVAFEGQFLLIDFADRNTPVLALFDRDLRRVRAGESRLPAVPSTIVVTGDGAIFAGAAGAVAGIDPETLAPTCTLETSFSFQGAGNVYLFFHDTAEGDLVAYERSAAGC